MNRTSMTKRWARLNVHWLVHLFLPLQEVDLKAGSGYVVTMGEVVRTMMTKLDWFGTLFPRIPVNVQRELEDKIRVAKQTVR